MYTAGVVLATLACVAPLMWLYRNSLVNTAAEIIVDCDGRLRQANEMLDRASADMRRAHRERDDAILANKHLHEDLLRTINERNDVRREYMASIAHSQDQCSRILALEALLGGNAASTGVAAVDNIDLTAPQSNATVPVLGPESGVISISHQTP